MGRPKTFVVVGLGLIGGSLAASIRKTFPKARVIGVSRHVRNLRKAKKKGWIHEGVTHPKSAFQQADFIVISTPVDVIPYFIREAERSAIAGAIVTDAGSTKKEIVRWAARRHFRRIRFVGSHPLAGSHHRGLDHARADLFRGASVFVTPATASDRKGPAVCAAFWRKLGARPVFSTPELHDRIVSEVSHLPHAVASVLMHTVSKKALPYAASGFLDVTRIAASDPSIWVPIFLTNRSNLLRDLGRFEQMLKMLAAALRQNAPARIARFLAAASAKRKRL